MLTEPHSDNVVTDKLHRESHRLCFKGSNFSVKKVLAQKSKKFEDKIWTQ